MPDEMDFVGEQIEAFLESAISDVCRKAEIPAGEPGECENCFEETPRLIKRHCARCRDKLGLG